MFLDQQKAVSKIVGLICCRAEVLDDERGIDADEMRPLKRSANGEVPLRTTAEPDIEAAESTERVCSSHQCATAQHAP